AEDKKKPAHEATSAGPAHPAPSSAARCKSSTCTGHTKRSAVSVCTHVIGVTTSVASTTRPHCSAAKVHGRRHDSATVVTTATSVESKIESTVFASGARIDTSSSAAGTKSRSSAASKL